MKRSGIEWNDYLSECDYDERAILRQATEVYVGEFEVIWRVGATGNKHADSLFVRVVKLDGIGYVLP